MLELFAKASILLLECILQQSLNGKKKERGERGERAEREYYEITSSSSPLVQGKGNFPTPSDFRNGSTGHFSVQ